MPCTRRHVQYCSNVTCAKYQMSQSWHLLRNVHNKNGCSYLNVLVRFGETSQTAAAKNNWRLWIGLFQCIEDGSAPKANAVHVREKQHRLLLPHFVLSYYSYSYSSGSPHSHWILCAPSARRGTPTVWIWVVYQDLHMDVKGKYLGAGGNPISTALELPVY